MSYCRFSSDDFQCDVYVYDDVSGGVTIHVAGQRAVLKEPLPAPVPFPTFPDTDFKPFISRENKVMELIETANREPIALEFAGESFYGLEYGDAIGLLEKLRNMGYRIPSYAIEALHEELESKQ